MRRFHNPVMFGAGVFLFCIAGVWGQTTWEVELVDQGTVRGHRDVSGEFYSFLDVPYATTPTGTNRFKGPLPPPVWSETFDATYRGIACTQVVPNIESQDDCLVANIIVPHIDTNPPDGLPVIVSIHGGAYCMGVGSLFGLQSNMVKSKRLIVVSFNYRLGVPGFLCLGTADIPGNAGMKDQVALLRWVKKNIAQFGGNPNEVTIQGCSAGGGSADFLTISPMATGLFNKAIIGSGSVIGYYGALMDPIENAKTFAKLLNFTDVDDIEALENFYKTTPNEVLTLNFFDMFTDTMALYFAPCVERDTGTGEEIFLPESPLSLISKGQYNEIPLLYGYSEHEGLFHYEFKGRWDFENFVIEMSSNFSRHLPLDFQFETVEQREELANTVREFYFGDTMDEGSILEYIDYYTDLMYAYPMQAELGLRRGAKNDTVYLYEYGFADENTPFIPNTNVRGVTHCAQDNVLVDAQPPLTGEYLEMQETLREMWTNFVVSGRPVPEGSSLPQWPPVSGLRTPHMAIRNNFSLTESLIVEERAAFWDLMYEKYSYRHPIPPMHSGASSLVYSSLFILIVFFCLLP